MQKIWDTWLQKRHRGNET